MTGTGRPRARAGSVAAVAVTLALLACGREAPAPAAPSTADCAAELKARHAIDVTPEPRICAPLREALAVLGPASLADVHGLVIVRDQRGPCGDRCPDLASALMSDGALAFYATGHHHLHVVDATFAGPRWRGGDPDPAAVRAYLDQLGLADWPALVARVRTIPGVTLPAVVPEGSPLVFDAIVRHGPAALLGGEVSLTHLLIHELGHAALLRQGGESLRVERWSTLSGWGEQGGELADGYVGGMYGGEQPIVASRLLLGLPRGADTNYRPGARPHRAGGFASGYAAFDPIEDHAESFRLVHTDPVVLGLASPAKLLVVAAGEVDLRTPALRRFVRPGVEALLDPTVDQALAMNTLRAHGEALLPEAADLADPRPLPFPATLHPETRAWVDSAKLVVQIGPHQFRPTDAGFAALLVDWDRARAEYEEFERGLPALLDE